MTDLRPSWDELYMSMCYLVAARSPDESTHSGCVIIAPDKTIRSIGYNGFPRGIENTPERQERPLKYQVIEHCERNAFYNANRNGVSLQDCTLYVNWLPCADCARGIIQVGIKRVLVHRQGQQAFLMSRGESGDTVWAGDHDMVWEMLKEGNVEPNWYDGPIQMGVTGYFSGKTYAFLGPEAGSITPHEIGEEDELVWYTGEEDAEVDAA